MLQKLKERDQILKERTEQFLKEGEKRGRTIQSLKQEIQSKEEKQKTLSIEIASFKRKICELQTQCIHETRKREDAERQLETYKGDKTNDDLLRQIKTGREQNDQLRFQIQLLETEWSCRLSDSTAKHALEISRLKDEFDQSKRENSTELEAQIKQLDAVCGKHVEQMQKEVEDSKNRESKLREKYTSTIESLKAENQEKKEAIHKHYQEKFQKIEQKYTDLREKSDSQKKGTMDELFKNVKGLINDLCTDMEIEPIEPATPQHQVIERLDNIRTRVRSMLTGMKRPAPEGDESNHPARKKQRTNPPELTHHMQTIVSSSSQQHHTTQKQIQQQPQVIPTTTTTTQTKQKQKTTLPTKQPPTILKFVSAARPPPSTTKLSQHHQLTATSQHHKTILANATSQHHHQMNATTSQQHVNSTPPASVPSASALIFSSTTKPRVNTARNGAALPPKTIMKPFMVAIPKQPEEAINAAGEDTDEKMQEHPPVRLVIEKKPKMAIKQTMKQIIRKSGEQKQRQKNLKKIQQQSRHNVMKTVFTNTNNEQQQQQQKILTTKNNISQQHQKKNNNLTDQITPNTTSSTIDNKSIQINSKIFYTSASSAVASKHVDSTGKVMTNKTNSVAALMIAPELKRTIVNPLLSPCSAVTPKILEQSKLSPKWKYVSANASPTPPNSTTAQAAAPVYPQTTSSTQTYPPYNSPHGLKYKTKTNAANQFATTSTPPQPPHSYVPTNTTTNESSITSPTNGGYTSQKSFKQNQFFRVSGEVKTVANPLAAVRAPPVSVATTTLSHLPSLKIRFPRAKQKDVPFHLLKVGAPVDTPMPLHAVNFSKEWSFHNLTNYIRKLPEGMIEAWEVKGCDAKDFIGPFFKFYGDRKVVACCKLPNGDIIWAIPPSARDTLQCLKNKISCEFDGRGYIVITHSKKM